MIDETLQESASVYVLGMLEAEELEAFEAQMAQSSELRQHVDALFETAAQLAHATPAHPLPPHLESRIMAQIRDTRPAAPRVASSASTWIPWAIAACLATACVLLFTDRARMTSRFAELQHRENFAALRIAMLTSKLENAPAATAVVVWDPEKQQGVLKVSNTPANTAEQDYQLWIVDPSYKQPVDGGVFNVKAKGNLEIPFKPKAPVTSAEGFAISLERKGGVPKAEGPIVLVGK